MNNIHQNDVCYDESGLCAHNYNIILGFIPSAILEKALVGGDHLKDRSMFSLTLYNLCIFGIWLWNMK